MRFPKVLILILNWNGKKDTLECLASLAAAHPTPLFSAMIIDNGSTDDSIADIRAAFPEIPILENKVNLGFAGGNNAGIEWALKKSFEWILLLNNDTIVAPDLIGQLIRAAQEQPTAKILGAKIYRYQDRNCIDHCGGYWNPKRAEFFSYGQDKIDDGSWETMQRADYVSGCALFMHRSVPETIGLLEERYFLLWEEADFCARAKKAGFEIWTAPQAKVWHKVSASFTGGKPHMHYFWWRNRLLYISRNVSPAEKKELYRSVIGPEIFKTAQRALFKTLTTFWGGPIARIQKAKRIRAGWRGILDYFLGRFGNCPAYYRR